MKYLRNSFDKKFAPKVNHYQYLNVSQDASAAEIKSAYRKLARKKHPDLNGGNESETREFSKVANAYKVLRDPKRRADYDRELLQIEYSSVIGGKSSVFNSTNSVAARAREVAYERRFNAIIDRMIAEEKQETIAFQRVLFPVVSLLASVFFVAFLRPTFWIASGVPGKILIVTLFLVGLLHIIRRFRDGFDLFTYSASDLHDTLLHDTDTETRPYSRFSVIGFIVGGIVVSGLLGLLLGSFLERGLHDVVPRMFGESIGIELILFPPIAALLVDLMHSILNRES